MKPWPVAAKMPATSGEAHDVPATGSCPPLWIVRMLLAAPDTSDDMRKVQLASVWKLGFGIDFEQALPPDDHAFSVHARVPDAVFDSVVPPTPMACADVAG